MHIAIVSELFYPSLGGQELRYLEFGKHFVEKGWRVTVFTIDHSGVLKTTENVDGIEVHRIVKDKTYKNQWFGLPRNPISIIIFSLLMFWKLRSRTNYDCIIFNQWPLLPQIICNKKASDFIVNDWCELRSGLVWHIIQKLLMSSSKKHICVGSGLKRKLTTNYKIEPKQIEVIQSGIYCRCYKGEQVEKRKGILFFGRLSQHKHPELAIKATIKFIEKTGIDEVIYIAGSGPLLDCLKNRYDNNKIVKFLGKISDEEKIRLLSNVKVNLLPSEREGFPRTVAECMASGVPTITTIHPDNGTVDVIREYSCGTVVNPDIEQISNALINMYENKQYYQECVDNCYKYREELDWECLFNKFIVLLKG